jgi:Porin subfamily
MKMVKSLLLGSAAGVVAIAGAQAADLPVKAKPVQYVKICSLYGAGFYYIPGTDFCLKLGGWVRAEYNTNAGGSFNPIVRSAFNRTASDDQWRTRYVLTVDTRNQTEYGTLRTYITAGATYSNGAGYGAPGTASGLYAPRAFIQWAGFTAGVAVSFFDFMAFADFSNQTNIINSDTGGGGMMLFAYTAQLGNGLSASIALQDPYNVYNIVGVNGVTGTALNGGLNATRWPDVVGNIRLEQAWGSAQVMGAIHDVSATYYNGAFAGNPAFVPGAVQGNGYPGDEVGWAIGGGLRINMPWLGKGDHLSIQTAYTKGALGYVGSGLAGFAWYNGATAGFGTTLNGIYNSGVGGLQSGIELTEGWEVSAGFEHHWNAQWQTSLYGGYLQVNFNGNATSLLNTVARTPGASQDYSFWQIGSRTIWTPTKGLDLSVDVMYNHLDTAMNGQVIFGAASAANGRPNGVYTYADQDSVQGIFRVQRNFFP